MSVLKLWKPIVVAALVAGVGDLIYAFIHIGGYYSMEPMQILQSIARGVLGSETTKGGWGSAGLGLALEFVLTLIMATVYVAAAAVMTDLRRFWWIMGPCYGIVVMVVMYTVVLPLAATHGGGALPDGPRGSDGKVTDHQMLYGTILVHMFIIGLVISACTRFLWPKERTGAQ